VRQQYLLARVHKIGDEPIVEEDLRTDGHLDEHGLAASTVLTRTLARLACSGFVVHSEGERLEIAELRIDEETDIAAAAPVPTVGTAARNVFLTPKGDAAVPAIAGRHVDLCFIEEHGRPGTLDGRPKLA
jgi:hypothetical protein